MSDEFSGKVAVITGGSGGIGAATARIFSQSGCRVLSVDLTGSSPGEGIVHYPLDITDFNRVEEWVEKVVALEGRIDFLINNAGISRDSVLWKMTESQWDQVMEVNLKGAFHMIRHLSPVFRRQGEGRIVNITSINGLRGKFGLANYSASKAGLIGLTKTAARELGRYQVNVNAVAPGMVCTPLVEKLPSEYLEKATEEAVLGRLAEPEDIGRVVLFLCSEGSRHITGEVIKVDGGQYI